MGRGLTLWGKNMDKMQIDQFEYLLNVHGAELSDWPEERREAARMLLAQSPEAQSLLAEAQDLTSALDLYEVSPPDARFEARLLDLSPSPAASPQKTKRKRFAFDLRLISSAGIAFACAAFGVLAGLSATAPATTTDHAEAFMSVAAANYDTAFWGGDEG